MARGMEEAGEVRRSMVLLRRTGEEEEEDW